MEWVTGSEPQLDISFKVVLGHLALCHFDFKVESFLNHLPIVLSVDNSEETAEYRRQLNQCAQKVIEYHVGPNTNMEAVEVIEEANDINNSDIKPADKQEVQNVVDEVIQDTPVEEIEEEIKEEVKELENKDEEDRVRDVKINLPQEFKINGIPVQEPTGVSSECSAATKKMLLNRLRELVVENKLQDVKIFKENIRKCQLNRETFQIDAVLSFNGETCFIGAKRNSKSHQVTLVNQRESFAYGEENTFNCSDRFGTVELSMTSLSN